MKKMRAILISGILIAAVCCVFTACGTDKNNAADEAGTVQDNNNGMLEDSMTEDRTDETTIKDDTKDIKEDQADTAPGRDNNDADGNRVTDNNAAGNNITDNSVTDNGTDPQTGNTASDENRGSVSEDLGNSVKDLGDGVGNAVEDVGDAVDNAVNNR